MRKLIVPVDGSKTSLKALRFALDICTSEKARLVLVHVVCKVSPLLNGISRDYGENVLKDAKKLAAGKKIRVETKLLHGTPHEEIVKLAKKEKAFAIVMGTHGQTGLPRMLLGSVADRVLRNAECPVLLVPKKGDNDY